MNNKNLFLVNTPYQLMLVINMVLEVFNKEENDIIITNRIADNSKLGKRLENSGIFEKVFLINIDEEIRENDVFHIFKERLIPSKFKYLREKYNRFMFANLNHSVSAIFRVLKKDNLDIQIQMFEDGYATYSEYYGDYFKIYTEKSKDWKKVLRKWYHCFVDEIFLKIDTLYVLNPEVMTYNTYFNIKKMPAIDCNNKALINIYNLIFEYNESVDSYSQKIIFFEESYYADGYNCNDIEIVEKIANIVGKENLFIKIHPRNPKNRFKELGYKTNTNTSIPWEVIAMNMDLSKKILLSIASVSVLTPSTMLEKKYEGVLLMNVISDKSFLKQNITCLYENVCGNYENLHVIENYNELDNIINLSNI